VKSTHFPQDLILQNASIYKHFMIKGSASNSKLGWAGYAKAPKMHRSYIKA